MRDGFERDARRGSFLGGAAAEQEVDGGCELLAFQVAKDAPGSRVLARVLVGTRHTVFATEARGADAAPADAAGQLTPDAPELSRVGGHLAVWVEDGADLEGVLFGVGVGQP